MYTFPELRAEYTRMWNTLEIQANLKELQRQVTQIRVNSKRYQLLSNPGISQWFVGVIHMMESGCDFRTHLHNGDSLKARTVQEPKGRPVKGTPPFTWETSAIDALTLKNLDKLEPDDWTPERMAYELERYNGWGYRKYHPLVKSPYLWSRSNHYVRGKYVSDGEWSSTAVSDQIGAMVLLRVLIT